MKLLRLAEWRSAEPGEVLARQGERQAELALICNGEVSIARDGGEIARGRDGTLVGEMSYISGAPATATVSALRPTRLLVWPQDTLRHLLRRNPTMDVAMQSVFNVDLIRKLGAPA
jgi:CRP-like cAMP-binding protein